MTFVLQTTVYDILIVTAVIAIAIFIIYGQLKKYDPLSKPTGLVVVLIMAVEIVEDLVREKTNEEMVKKLTPYIMSVGIYIFLSNIAGLFLISSPTSNFSVTLSLALITCVMIEVYSIKYNGLKKYFHSFLEPFAPFLIVNIISKFSTLASLSLRLFGNIVAGSILMSIIYQLLAIISSVVPVVGEFNFVGVIIAPILHAYFDLFSGAIQTYIFAMLSVSFIGKELPSED